MWMLTYIYQRRYQTHWRLNERRKLINVNCSSQGAMKWSIVLLITSSEVDPPWREEVQIWPLKPTLGPIPKANTSEEVLGTQGDKTRSSQPGPLWVQDPLIARASSRGWQVPPPVRYRTLSSSEALIPCHRGSVRVMAFHDSQERFNLAVVICLRTITSSIGAVSKVNGTR